MLGFVSSLAVVILLAQIGSFKTLSAASQMAILTRWRLWIILPYSRLLAGVGLIKSLMTPQVDPDDVVIDFLFSHVYDQPSRICRQGGGNEHR